MLLGALGEYIFRRTGVPDLIWLLLAGMLAGPVFGIVRPEVFQPVLAPFGAIALVMILLGGALQLRVAELTAAAPRALTLGLVGFAFSVAATCGLLFITAQFGWTRSVSWLEAMLVGSIVGGTCSAVIFPTLALADVPARLARLLEVESLITDILVVVVTMVLLDRVLDVGSGWGDAPLALARQVLIAVLVGMFAALMLALLLRAQIAAHGYTIGIALFLLTYLGAVSVGGSGALAVLVCGILVGNVNSWFPRVFGGKVDLSAIDAASASLVVHNQMVFFIKAFFFFLIGLMFPTSTRLIALGAAFALMLLFIRILATRISLRGSSLPRSERWLASVAVPRGLATGVLATLPSYSGVQRSQNLAPVVFATIAFSILLFAACFALLNRSRRRAAS